MRRRDILALIAISVTAVLPAHAKRLRIDFQQLISGSDVIVVAKVINVSKDRGVKVARAVPTRTFKGKAHTELRFIAQPTWTCDSSHAVTGETAILFLEKTKSKRQTIQSPNEPPSEVASEPLYALAWDGRGRMPIAIINGITTVPIDHSDLDLPKSAFPKKQVVCSRQFVTTAWSGRSVRKSLDSHANLKVGDRVFDLHAHSDRRGAS